jgi:CheY-like chemotaxis protein
MMPDIDGFAFARAVKAIRAPPAHVDHAGHPRDCRKRARADEVGFAVLSKPVKQSELLDAIVTVCGPRTVSERPAALRTWRPSSSRAPQRPLRILVAEDNATNQKLIVTLLELQQHTVVVAPNGRDAVRLAEDQRFDLILMDVQMPEMSGLEATAAIRQREEASGAHVPIVAMTAHAMAGDRERCLAAGMDGYVSKPLRPEELFGAIDDLFASEPFADAVPAAGPAPVEHALDGPALLAGFSGNKKLLGEVIDVFLADSPNLMLAIRTLWRSTTGRPWPRRHTRSKDRSGCSSSRTRIRRRAAERAAAGGDLAGVQEACATLEEEMAVCAKGSGIFGKSCDVRDA